MSSAPMAYRTEGKRRSLQIAGVADAEIEAFPGQGGADITIANRPLCISPGHAAVVSKSKTVAYQDYGLVWEFSGKPVYAAQICLSLSLPHTVGLFHDRMARG